MTIVKALQSADLHLAASTFVHQHGHDLSRDQQVQQAARYLMQTFQCTENTAGITAAQVVAEMDSAGCNGFVHLDHSTSYCVMLVVDGQKRVISLRELMKYFDHKDSAGIE